MSYYLDKLKKFSKSPKLVYSTDRWLKAIAHMEDIEQQLKETQEALEPFAKFACGCGKCNNCVAFKILENKTSHKNT